MLARVARARLCAVVAASSTTRARTAAAAAAVLSTDARAPPVSTVLFDLGGVILDSPMGGIAAFEAEAGLPPRFVNKTIGATGVAGSFARLEVGV